MLGASGYAGRGPRYWFGGVGRITPCSSRASGNAWVGSGAPGISSMVTPCCQSAGATGRGGLLRIDGNASSRCGISMKGIDIVVKGSVGHMSAFMAQAGNLVVFGDAGDALGDSIYEARLFVRGKVRSLGADCIEKPMRDEHKRALHEVLGRGGFNGAIDPSEFRRYGSARKLYNFHVDDAGAY